MLGLAYCCGVPGLLLNEMAHLVKQLGGCILNISRLLSTLFDRPLCDLRLMVCDMNLFQLNIKTSGISSLNGT